MKQKKAYLSTLKWGAILGIGLSVFELVKMCARKIEYGNTQLLDIALIIGFILILYAGIKEFKALYTERLTFAKAYWGCIIISLVGSILFFAYGNIHYQVVEPDGLKQKYEIALGNFKKVIERDTISTEEITQYLETVKTLIQSEEKKFVWNDTTPENIRSEAHLGVSKITTFYQNKILEKRPLDTANNYVMSNFQSYSRKTLIETLASYIAQNEQKTSTTAVKDIIEKSNAKMSEINPADIRFEKNKSHVPHYDKPGRYAAVAAMMDLLYGMFFGLFIAMYHYTSKKTFLEMQVDSENKIPEEDSEIMNTESLNSEEETKNN